MKTFETDIALRWGDMDAMGHVNNVQYFRLMEEARVQWLAQLDTPMKSDGEAPILAHVSCDFARPMNYPGTARVKQTVSKLGRSSVEIQVAIERADEPGVVYATGRAVIVWYDYKAAKSTPWPEAVRAAIAS